MRIMLIVAACAAVSAQAWAKPHKRIVAPVPVAAPTPDPAEAAAERLRRIEARTLCLSEQGRLQLAVQQQQSQCEARAADHRACVARVRDRQVSSTGRGALIGIGAAVLTGGSSLLFTGAGALIGHETSDEAPSECGVAPACTAQAAAEAAARATGLRARECPAAQ